MSLHSDSDYMPCLICGGESAVTAVFTPQELTNGVQRHIVYELCEQCMLRQDREAEAEVALTLRGVKW